MKPYIIIGPMMLAVCMAAPRQSRIVNIACVDVQKIIEKVSADKGLMTILQNQRDESLKRAEEMARDVQKLKDILEKERGTLRRERRNAIREEIIMKEERLKDYLSQKQKGIQKRGNVLTEEVMRGIYRYIKEVAIFEGYAMILEKTNTVVYVDPKLDITSKVIELMEKKRKKLGL